MFHSSCLMVSNKAQKDQADHASSPCPGRRGTTLKDVTWVCCECKESGHQKREGPKQRSRPAETDEISQLGTSGSQALRAKLGLGTNFEASGHIFKTSSIYVVSDNLTVATEGPGK